jgi:hypothetical protein
MATMIPDIDVRAITNNGERLVYSAASRLPPDFTVLYSFKYMDHLLGSDLAEEGEADFVFVHPALGYAVMEVKQGDILFANGQWHEFKGARPVPLHKDPVEQAQRAMYGILDRYKEAAHTEYFPLKIRFALGFPECTRILGQTPAHVGPDSILCFMDLERLEEWLVTLFGGWNNRHEREVCNLLVRKVLSPTFKVFARLDDHIAMFHQFAERVFTEEQQRILDETELDKRKIFFGAAGTGKTFLAMEKARRLSSQGKRVFLTCFNRHLANYLRKTMPPKVTCSNFHDFVLHVAQLSDPSVEVPRDPKEVSAFYDEVLPTRAFDHFCSLSEREKFDSIIVDEGQDFKETWYVCLESMVRSDGDFYIFADLNQDLFNGSVEKLQAMPVSKHRLTRNLRNGEPISEWLSTFVHNGILRPGLRGGLPIVYEPWDTYAEERRLIEREIGRLVSQGIKPWRIVILSPNRKDKSCLQDCDRIREWPLVDFPDETGSGIRFATIRSFKGLEADVVFLIGLKQGKQTCTETDVYVGGSRARFLLYVFYNRAEPPAKLGRGAKEMPVSTKPR